MTAGSQNYTAVLDVQTYLVPMRFSAMDLDDLETAQTDITTFLNPADAISGPKVVNWTGTGSTFELFVDERTLSISNVARATNVVTITTSAVHGLVAGDKVKVAAVTNTGVNGSVVVASAPTTTTFTYTLNGANITSGADTGTVKAGLQKLDGTDKPIRVLSLTGIPFSMDTTTDGALTLDAVTLGTQINIATGNSFSASVSGLSAHKNVDWKLMTCLSERNTAEGLIAKMLRVGPGGTVEKKYGFIRVESFSEDGDAGALSKWTANYNVIGPLRTLPDNVIA